MFANRILAPFAILGAVFLILAWTTDEGYAIYFVPCLVVAALIYILSPQINWWWYSRNPPDLSVELTVFLERCSPFYARLDQEEKRRFRARIVLFNMGTDWEPLAFPEDTLPPDVQMAISAQAVALTFRREKFLFEKFEKVVVFPRPFPSPEHPYDHASELHVEDGCLLLSAEQVMLAFAQPAKWYNVAMHEYAKAYVLQFPGEPWPDFSDEGVWTSFESISGMSRTHVESVVGLAGIDALPVAIFHFFNFPSGFEAKFPEEYRSLSKIFSAA